MSGDQLAGELAGVRERGYALDMEENEVGVRCTAVPIFLGQAVPAAAVSVTVLGFRADLRRLSELGQYLRAITADWSERKVVSGGRTG
jgi:IclR family acetate operon transcriptional repressor